MSESPWSHLLRLKRPNTLVEDREWDWHQPYQTPRIGDQLTVDGEVFWLEAMIYDYDERIQMGVASRLKGAQERFVGGETG